MQLASLCPSRLTPITVNNVSWRNRLILTSPQLVWSPASDPTSAKRPKECFHISLSEKRLKDWLIESGRASRSHSRSLSLRHFQGQMGNVVFNLWSGIRRPPRTLQLPHCSSQSGSGSSTPKIWRVSSRVVTQHLVKKQQQEQNSYSM